VHTSVLDSLNKWLSEKNWYSIQRYFSERQSGSCSPLELLAKAMLLAYGPKEQRDNDTAISCLERASSLAPSDARYSNVLSGLLLQLNQPVKALAVGKEARRIDAQNPMSAVALARAAWVCRERDLACQNFRDAFDLLPKEHDALRQQMRCMAYKLSPFWWKPLYGKRLKLVRMKPVHQEFLLQCRQNIAFQHHYNLFQKNSPEAVSGDLKLADHPPVDSRKIEWIIEKEEQAVGLAALVDLDLKNSRAEILIGFPEKQFSGSALEASLLVMEFAFVTIGLHKVTSYVYSDNTTAQKNTLHFGFRQEGFLESHVADPATNERLGLYVNGCLVESFFTNKKLMALARRLLGRVPTKVR
jgi:RimJ/RimL family protein N-acetyltransferase